MNIAVFGTGYVGLVQGAILADAGHQVVCVDIDEVKLERLRKGDIPIFEPGLEPIVKANHAEQRLVGGLKRPGLGSSGYSLSIRDARKKQFTREFSEVVRETQELADMLYFFQSRPVVYCFYFGRVRSDAPISDYVSQEHNLMFPEMTLLWFRAELIFL
jgi:hypothetical protein